MSVSKELSIREVDMVVVKGKLNRSPYEVLDYDEEEFPNVMDVVNHFNSAVAQYRKQQWERAIQGFERALTFNPNDNLCKTYLERCAILQSNPPGDDWNGVWVMKTK